MAPKPGNAWAQRQEKERQFQMQQSSPRKDGNDKSQQSGSGRVSGESVTVPHQDSDVPQPQQTAAGKASFKLSLDFDEELALPMPKPRTASKQPLPPPTTATHPFKQGGSKGRSFTEPSDVNASEGMNPKPLFAEKKVTEKSKVASLKSKFSIKDIGKEAKVSRKDSEKKDTPNDTAEDAVKETAKETTNPTTESGKGPQVLGEAKLYVPRPKEPDMGPLSAPPQHTSDNYRNSDSSDDPQSRTVSSTPGLPPGPFSLKTPEKTTESNIEKPLLSPSETGTTIETPQANYVVPREKIEGMIIGDHSLSAARAGTYAVTGNAELVTSQLRIVSMQAEVEQGQEKQDDGDSRHLQLDSGASEQVPIYSPSVYNVSGGGAWEQMQRVHPDTMPQYSSDRPSFDTETPTKSPTRDEGRGSGPVIVSSDQASRSQSTSHTDLTPTALTFTPNPMASGENPCGVNAGVSENAFFGVTSHGGYAPPRPHPSYQSTITFEQQLAGHADSIHHHLSSAVNRLGKVFGDTNNWLMDQVLHNVESLSEASRLLTSRSMSQTEIASEAR
ncbi:hypothetical protein VTN02DRAFT_5427 [Thermoascus thermophilus]